MVTIWRWSTLPWLIEKEWRELVASRAWWVLLLCMGPLVGLSFISSVRTYAEVSGLNGTAAGVGEALSPLIGVWAPTFSACELAAVFLLPFVAIRLVAGDRQNGALKLELQQPMSPLFRIGAKALVLLGGWLVAMLPPLSAIVLWRFYGGSIYAPELLTLTLGHVLNAGLTIGLAAAMASITEHPSTAAILTLGITIGTWIVNFVAAVQGGWWERAAGYTPAAMVAEFQHGLLKLDTLLIVLVLIFAGLSVAAVWTRLGMRVSRRAYESAGVVVLAAGSIFACMLVTRSWDTSEGRINSLSEADEQVLRQIHGSLRIEAHLAPEDPRRLDLERRALSKLRRIMPRLEVQYVSATSIGLFEQTNAGYGEIWYELDGRRTMSRVTTEEGVLEAIYSVAGDEPPKNSSGAPTESAEPVFRGHPLAAAQRRWNIFLCSMAGSSYFQWHTGSEESEMKIFGGCGFAFAGVFFLAATAATANAADIKVSLAGEQIGKPPAVFEPMVGTWVVAQDGGDKVIMIDGRPWVASRDNPTRLLLQSARRLYGTSNEELMDNAKQFAYYPVAVLKAVDNFSDGTISMKFKTMGGEADRCSGILFNVKPNGDWLAVRYNDTENNVALWEFHNGIRRNIRFSDRAKPFMLDRSAWHELKMTVDGTSFKAWLDGAIAIEYTLGSEPAAGRRGPADPDLFPANNPVLRPPVAGEVGLWSKTDSTSYFKDYVVSPKP